MWTNLNGGNWTVAANWNPNQVPTIGDDAFITNNGIYVVTLNVTTTNNSLTLGGITGQQTFANSANTLTLSNASFVNANGIFALSGGTLAGPGLLTVNGLFNWTGGTLGGFTAVAISSSAVLNISGVNGKTLEGILTNAGTINWSGTGNLQFINNGSTLNGTLYNLAGAVFNIQNDQTFINSSGLEFINNAGMFRKLGGVGTTTVDPIFTNSGTLDVESGMVSFASGGTSSGTFTNVAGTTIANTGGNYMFAAGSQVTGLGTNLWTGGNVTANTIVTTLNVLLNGSATLFGTNSFTGTLTWNGGTIGGLANVTIPVSTVLNISGVNGKTLEGILTNAGTINWSGTGNLQFINNGSTLNGTLYNLAGAVFNIQNDQTFINSSGLEFINNAGMFRKLGGVGTTTVDPIFTNSGTLDVESGMVSFASGGTSSGTFTNVAGTTIANTGGNYMFAAGSQVTGLGTNLWTGGNVTANTIVTTLNVLLNGSATLFGTNSFTGTLTWNGGTIGGLANVTIPVSTVLNISGVNGKTLEGILTNAGTINWSGTGNLQFINNGSTLNGTLYNLAGAVFNIQNDQTFINSSGLEFINNAGMFRKLGGVGTTTVDPIFTNSGTLDVESGMVSFASGGTSSGTFTNVAGTTIANTGGNYMFAAGSQVTGLGTNLWTGGNVTANTIVTTLNVLLNGSATLFGTNSFTGTLTWNGGAIGGLANVTIPVSTVLNISGVNGKTLEGILTNAGTINWSGTGNLQFINNGSTLNGTLYNLAGAVFNIQNDQTFINSSGLEFINNAGMFRKLGGVGTTTVDPIFTNSGTLDAQSGIVSLISGHSLTKGTLNFGINSLANFGKINLSGAAALTGTVSANLNNGYVPVTNNSFAVLTYGSLTGIFTNTILPVADAWETNYAATIFTLIVLNARPMLLTNATQTVDELTTLTVTNTATDLDLPPQTLTFSLSGPTNGMSINPASGVFTWTPAQTNSPSTNIVTVVVTDSGTPPLSTTNSFSVIVVEVNTTPVLPNISSQTINALALLTVTNTATETNIHATLGYVLVNPPAGAGIDVNGIITWTPSRPQGPGTNTIITVVTNTDVFDLINPHLSATNIFTVVVFAPTLAPMITQTVNVGQTVSFTDSATDNDGTRTLTFSLLSAPATAGINANTGQFTWRPPVTSAGSSNNVQVQVTDNSVPPLTDTKSFAVLVNTLTAVLLTPTAYSNGQFTLQVNGPAGPDYILQGAATLGQNVVWGNLLTNTPGTLPFSVTDTNANGFTNRFYREQLGP